MEGISASEREMPDAKEKILGYIRSYAKTSDNVTEDFDAGGMESAADMKINVQIGSTSFTATLEDNAAAREFAEMMKDAPVSI